MIVLGITRQGLGVMNLPPNQVLVGLALFLSLFTMRPVLGQLKSDVGSDDERENNSKSSRGNDSSYYERIYVKAYV